MTDVLVWFIAVYGKHSTHSARFYFQQETSSATYECHHMTVHFEHVHIIPQIYLRPLMQFGKHGAYLKHHQLFKDIIIKDMYFGQINQFPIRWDITIH